jgi:hypothetical protein
MGRNVISLALIENIRRCVAVHPSLTIEQTLGEQGFKVLDCQRLLVTHLDEFQFFIGDFAAFRHHGGNFHGMNCQARLPWYRASG